MLPCECSSHGGHRIGKAIGVEREQVEVPLYHYNRLFLHYRLLSLIEAVEGLSLPEYRGLGGVEVLGLAGAKNPAAEAYGAPPCIYYRKDKPSPEPVICPAAIFFYDQPGLDSRLGGDAGGLQEVDKPVPAVRGETHLELVGGLFAVAPALEVPARGLAVRRAERLAEEVGGGLERPVHLISLIGRPLCLFRYYHAETVGKRHHGLGKAHPLPVHEEGYDIARGVAAEAVVDGLFFVYRK